MNNLGDAVLPSGRNLVAGISKYAVLNSNPLHPDNFCFPHKGVIIKPGLATVILQKINGLLTLNCIYFWQHYRLQRCFSEGRLRLARFHDS